MYDSLQVDELLKQRDNILSSFTIHRSVINSSGDANSSCKTPDEDIRFGSPNGSLDVKNKLNKKKWFNLNLNHSDRKG